MAKDDVEWINLALLVSVNLLTFLRNAIALHKLVESQRRFKVETRERLDSLESPGL